MTWISLATLLRGFLLWSCLTGTSYTTSPHFELGDLPQAEKSQFTFKVRNPFPESFEITEVVKSCGCSRIDIDEKYKVVHSGEEFEVKVEVDAPRLQGIEKESFSTLLKIVGAKGSHVIDLKLTGLVIPRVLAEDGLPRFSLTSPPTDEQMRKRLYLKSTDGFGELSVEVISPHCVGSIRDLKNGKGLLSLRLLNTIQTARPKELRIRIVSSKEEVVADFLVQCDYRSDLRLICEPKVIIDLNESLRRSHRVYFGETTRNLLAEDFEAYLEYKDRRLDVPFEFGPGTSGSSLRKVHFDFSAAAKDFVGGEVSKFVFRCLGRDEAEVELWFQNVQF
jgi:hypothetical protein